MNDADPVIAVHTKSGEVRAVEVRIIGVGTEDEPVPAEDEQSGGGTTINPGLLEFVGADLLDASTVFAVDYVLNVFVPTADRFPVRVVFNQDRVADMLTLQSDRELRLGRNDAANFGIRIDY